MKMIDSLTQPRPSISTVKNANRRQFMYQSGGLLLAICGSTFIKDVDALEKTGVEPNAFVQIGEDNIVTIVSQFLEMGQGAYTGLATLAAEELDASWHQIRVIGAPIDITRYKNSVLGVHGTGASTALAESYEPMRKAGATLRVMLVAAAAKQWNVPERQISVHEGVVSHPLSGKKASFGDLASAAAKQPIPSKVTLKHAKDFRLIGKTKLPRVDSAAKTNGTAIFTQDIQLPNMLVAVPLHPPRFGAQVKSVDASNAKRIPGVIAVIQFAGTPFSFSGVAVLAKNTWIAKQGRDALIVEWDESKAQKLGSTEMLERYRTAATQTGKIAVNTGNAEQALQQAEKRIEADYFVPYLAHAPMEPLNCVVQLTEAGCEIWNGEQFQTTDQATLAKFLNLKKETIKIHQLYAGGSFGRRANPHADYLVEAVSIAKTASEQGIKVPIKMVWMREEDMRSGYYRPMNLHRARLAINAEGKLTAWHVRLIGQSLLRGTAFSGWVKEGIDPTSVEGQANLAYDLPNLLVESTDPTEEGHAVPVQWLRSVGHTHTAFTVEGLIDEAAIAAGKDPVKFRLDLLHKRPRHLGVLQLAATKAQWGTSLSGTINGQRRGRGIAVHESFNSYVAHVVEVTVHTDGSVKVDRVVCAIDCGIVVNPDVVKAQMEGSIGFAVGATLYGAITLKDGVVEQSNFHDYRTLRIDEMPQVEVYIVPSTEKPTGVGEPGVPPVAPAIVNAIYNAVGKRLRSLPVGEQLLAQAS